MNLIEGDELKARLDRGGVEGTGRAFSRDRDRRDRRERGGDGGERGPDRDQPVDPGRINADPRAARRHDHDPRRRIEAWWVFCPSSPLIKWLFPALTPR